MYCKYYSNFQLFTSSLTTNSCRKPLNRDTVTRFGGY